MLDKTSDKTRLLEPDIFADELRVTEPTVKSKRKRQEKVKKKRGRKTREPEPGTLGHTVWLIVGGRAANMGMAAERLSVAQSLFSSFMHGERTISPKSMMKKEWPKVFAKFYPQTWAKYEDVFEAQLVPLVTAHESLKQIAKVLDPKTIKANWRLAAAEFVTRLLQIRGDTIQDILPDVGKKVPEIGDALKDQETWDKILKGDEDVSPLIYKKAIKEVCRLYQIDAMTRPKKFHQFAQKLIRNMEKHMA